MPTNEFLTPQIIAREALSVLQRTRIMTDLVNSDFSNEFRSVGDMVNVRIPATLHGRAFIDTVTRQEVKEGKLPVKLDRIADISVGIESRELTLDIENFSRQVIEPAIRGLNQKIDNDISAFIFAQSNKTIEATDDGTLKPIAEVGKYFDNEAAPTFNRYIVFSPDHKYRYAQAENLSKVAYAGTSETLRDALLGRIYGNDTIMSNNLPYSTADVAGTATEYKVESVSGDKRVVKLTGVTPATGTVKKGDGFIYKNVLYRFGADAVAVAGVIASVALHIASDDFPTNVVATDALIIPDNLSLAFHRDAITFVTAPLELPIGGTNSYVAQGEGFAIRVVMDYDSDTKQNLISFDVLYGVNGLHEHLAVKLEDN